MDNLENLMKQYSDRYENQSSNVESSNYTSRDINNTNDDSFNELLKIFGEEPTKINNEEITSPEEQTKFDELEKNFDKVEVLDTPVINNKINEKEFPVLHTKKIKELTHALKDGEYQLYVKELLKKYGKNYAINLNPSEKDKYIRLNSEAYNISIAKSQETLKKMIENDRKEIEENKKIIASVLEKISNKYGFINHSLNSISTTSDEISKRIDNLNERVNETKNIDDNSVENVNQKNNILDQIIVEIKDVINKNEEYKSNEEKRLKEQEKLIEEFKNYHFSLAKRDGKKFYITMSNEEKNNYINLYMNAYKIPKEEAISMLEHLTLEAYNSINKEKEEIAYNETLDILNKYFNYFNEVDELNNYDAMKICQSFISDTVRKYESNGYKSLPEKVINKIKNIDNRVKYIKDRIEFEKNRKQEKINNEFGELKKDLTEKLNSYNMNKNNVDKDIFNKYIEANKGFDILSKHEVDENDLDNTKKYINLLSDFEKEYEDYSKKQEDINALKSKLGFINIKINNLLEELEPYKQNYTKVKVELEKVVEENNDIDKSSLNEKDDYEKAINDKQKLLDYLNSVINFIKDKEKDNNNNSSINNYNSLKNLYGKQGVEKLKEIYSDIDLLTIDQKAEFENLYNSLLSISKNTTNNENDLKQQLVEISIINSKIDGLKQSLNNKKISL